VGAGVGFAGTPASHSLTGSVPVDKAGMASGTADLQRGLGGAIMQSILGALLAERRNGSSRRITQRPGTVSPVGAHLIRQVARLMRAAG
jgi:DHA2 family multidrug resistance protein-like MFS transporter